MTPLGGYRIIAAQGRTMLESLKQRMLTRGPFAQAHMGHWIRTRTFEHYFDSELKDHPVRRVLDAGCGDGDYAQELARRLPGAEIVGIDILSSPRWADKRLGNLSFRQGDLLELDESEAYDLIISVDSLEHIPDNRAVLRAFWRALRPGGLMYVAMPNDDQKTFLPEAWFADQHEWQEHEHIGEEYDLEGLRQALQSEGFSIRLARHTFTFWGRLSWELYTVLHGSRLAFRARTLGMPLFKLLGVMDLHLPVGAGHNLVIAQKAP